MASIIYSYFHRLRNTVCVVVPVLLLPACDKLGSDTSQINAYDNNLDVSLRIPSNISIQSVGGYSLQADVLLTLNGASKRYPLTVNNDDSVSGSINNLDPGVYTLYLEYFVTYAGIRLALASYENTSVTVGSGLQTNIEITSYNVSHDYDNDGATNLAELRLGSSPITASEVPSISSQFTSLADASYGKTSTSSGLQIEQRIGEPIAGDAGSSTNFKLRSGFSQ